MRQAYRALPFFLTTAFLITVVSCGGGGGPIASWQGSAGNALLIDGYNNAPPSQLWVGFNSETEFQKVRDAASSQQVVTIYGVVVADAHQSSGFYLDPNSTKFWPGGIPELVHSMGYVSENVPQLSGGGVVLMVRVSQLR